MDRLVSLNIFRNVVEAGSFAAAADRLGLSPPMASKHVARLERVLGARLLHRSSRHLSLTEAGALYYEKCVQALDALNDAEAAIGTRTQSPRGLLRVSAPVWCANAHFAAVMARYRERYPEVNLDLRLENRKVDLVQEGFDLALRATQEPSDTLIARPLCEVPFHLVGTPATLQRAGWPALGGTVLDAVLPSYIKPESMRSVGLANDLPFTLRPAFSTDDTTLAYHLVHADAGVAFLPDWLVAQDLQQGRLQRLLPALQPPLPIMLFAVYVSRQYLPPKLRSFIDVVSAELAGR